MGLLQSSFKLSPALQKAIKTAQESHVLGIIFIILSLTLYPASTPRANIKRKCVVDDYKPWVVLQKGPIFVMSSNFLSAS